MRRYRTLTSSDRWDLAVLLGVLVVGLAGAAAVNRHGLVPHFFAFASQHDATAEPAVSPAATTTSLNLNNALRRPELMPDILGLDANAAGPPPIVRLAAPATPASRVAAAKALEAANNFKWYDGTKYRYLKTLKMRVTAYAPDKRCCWPYPGTTTASGESVKTNRGKLVAADTRVLPFNSLVSIPGYHAGEAVPVLDRGSAIKGHRIDVLLPNFAQAQEWGARMVEVKIYVPVDE